MNLPIDIWTNILKNTDKFSCENLYIALPKFVKKAIHRDYINHMQSLKEHICFCMGNKVNVYRDDERINLYIHTNSIYMVKFIPETSKIIISTYDGKVIIWDYITNYSETIFNSSDKISFVLSPCSKYIIIYKSYSTDNSLHFYNLMEKNIKNIPFYYLSPETFLQIVFNPIKKEFVILSYYFNDYGESVHNLKMINYEKMNVVYSSDEEFYKCYFNKEGTLYALKYMKGFYQFNGDSFDLIYRYLGFVLDFLIDDDVIYLSNYLRNQNANNISRYNLKTKKTKVLFKRELYSLKNLCLSEKKDILVCNMGKKIIFIYLKKEEEYFTDNKISIQEKLCIENDKLSIMENFDIKNFYKKMKVF